MGQEFKSLNSGVLFQDGVHGERVDQRGRAAHLRRADSQPVSLLAEATLVPMWRGGLTNPGAKSGDPDNFTKH